MLSLFQLAHFLNHRIDLLTLINYSIINLDRKVFSPFPAIFVSHFTVLCCSIRWENRSISSMHITCIFSNSYLLPHSMESAKKFS